LRQRKHGWRQAGQFAAAARIEPERKVLPRLEAHLLRGRALKTMVFRRVLQPGLVQRPVAETELRTG